MFALFLVSCGIVIAAGLTWLAIRERHWGLAIFMGLITLASLAADYVAYDCLGKGCLFEEPSSRRESFQLREDGDA